MGKKGIPHRKFSKEEKMKYIRLHLDEHMPLRQIERECGIRNTLVAEWVKRYLQDGEDALEPHNGNPYATLYRSKNLSEVERLRLLVWFYPIHMLLLSLVLLLMQSYLFILSQGCSN